MISIFFSKEEDRIDVERIKKKRNGKRVETRRQVDVKINSFQRSRKMTKHF